MKSGAISEGPSQLIVDDESALDAAIEDAAGLKEKQAENLMVTSIQLNQPVGESIQELDSKLSESLSQNSATQKGIVSALLVSERQYSGTESVQISEKLINRES